MAYYAFFIVMGLLVGLLSGLVGLGGGVFLIPALVMVAGFTQHQAVGTTLMAMVPPVTLAAALAYHKHGYVDVKLALMLSVTLALGSWISASYAHRIPAVWLHRLFGAVLLVVAAKFLFKK